MILLDAHESSIRCYKEGGRYRARPDSAGSIDIQAQSVWRFIRESLGRPIELVIDPMSDADTPDLGGLEQTLPTGSGCCTSRLILFTSGTTGVPKAVEHNVSQAMAGKRPGSPDAIWLLTYAPWRWAGVSVLMHVLKSGAKVVAPESLEADQLIRSARGGGVSHISLTPSLLRKLDLSCGSETLAALPLQQVTFGGESATQPVLDLAGRLWPNARITHVYASTEAGDVCAVSDGEEGIPVSKLSGDRFGFDEGELVIDGRATGDLWDHRDGRYFFLGRREEVINVGGAKVSPIEVESAATSMQGVAAARAYGESSALLGQVVVLEYAGTADEREVKRGIRELLPKVAWPVQVSRVDQISMTDAGKTRRIQGRS